MTETQLSRAIQAELIKAGFWIIRIQSGKVKVRGAWMYLAQAGTPDLYLPGHGHLEVKVPGKSLNNEQREWHAKARQHGVRVEVAESPAQALEIALRWRQEREWERSMGWPEKSA